MSKKIDKNRKFLIISDSHGHANYISDAAARHPDADSLIFLGDGRSDLDFLATELEGIKVFAVNGNCDIFHPFEKNEILLNVGKHSILMMHGHKFNVKCGLGRAIRYAQAKNADILLFGHTHIPFYKYLPPKEGKKGLYLFNPGSIGERASYGVLEIRQGKTLFYNAKL